MAICVQLQADGTLVPTGEPVEQCSGSVLLSGTEYATVQVLDNIFMWPEPEVAASWFGFAFFLILALNVVGSMTGSVVKSLSTDRD